MHLTQSRKHDMWGPLWGADGFKIQLEKVDLCSQKSNMQICLTHLTFQWVEFNNREKQVWVFYSRIHISIYVTLWGEGVKVLIFYLGQGVGWVRCTIIFPPHNPNHSYLNTNCRKNWRRATVVVKDRKI